MSIAILPDDNYVVRWIACSAVLCKHPSCMRLGLLNSSYVWHSHCKNHTGRSYLDSIKSIRHTMTYIQYSYGSRPCNTVHEQHACCGHLLNYSSRLCSNTAHVQQYCNTAILQCCNTAIHTAILHAAAICSNLFGPRATLNTHI